ncbi:unconventionnal myosin-X [Anopheles sinensis]|uniref:Unconventionnal myosin-X n=1 Tax=Anopheles sinensis TaxID=74873 RepID=A0A084VDY9_ANOSI|nr:unconventionnal myosin-X [Anopheles sinensis]
MTSWCGENQIIHGPLNLIALPQPAPTPAPIMMEALSNGVERKLPGQDTPVSGLAVSGFGCKFTDDLTVYKQTPTVFYRNLPPSSSEDNFSQTRQCRRHVGHRLCLTSSIDGEHAHARCMSKTSPNFGQPQPRQPIALQNPSNHAGKTGGVSGDRDSVVQSVGANFGIVRLVAPEDFDAVSVEGFPRKISGKMCPSVLRCSICAIKREMVEFSNTRSAASREGRSRQVFPLTDSWGLLCSVMRKRCRV